MVEDFSDEFEKLEKPEMTKFIGAMKSFFYNILFCILEFLYVLGCVNLYGFCEKFVSLIERGGGGGSMVRRP
ncbi:hypothetical protein RchiOBHm_Chr7g0215191 [Rosa chinensis]|uniref:Transmembrane protein n=1 Tax=Rosa chinensis TaxID=74649 RepID=A0A2P6PBE6_ROSCH|nr:hypothetical protein RchiOBHm_Chr7g0215191 [Rosa chinensis]